MWMFKTSCDFCDKLFTENDNMGRHRRKNINPQGFCAKAWAIRVIVIIQKIKMKLAIIPHMQ